MSDLIKNFGAYTVTGLTQGAIYALVALGYTLVYGVLRLINFAHSEVFMVGTFAVAGVLTMLVHGTPTSVVVVIGLLIVALIAAAVASGITGIVVELVAYRPLRRRNAPVLVFLISAIGASQAISQGFSLWRGPDIQKVPTLVTPVPAFPLLDTNVTNLQLIIILGSVVMMVTLDQFIRRTRLGRGVRAIAQNPDAAALMGVNKDRVIALTFFVGGLMAGGAALLYDMQFGITRFNVGFLIGLKAFTAAVLGGIGNLRGALLGGLLLGVVENWSSPLIGSQWRDVVAFVLLIAVLMFRPTGILGESLGRARA